MTDKKFIRVELEDELRSDTDKMPVFRRCFEHETLMSFYDDDGNYAFREWWDEVGSNHFLNWMLQNEEWCDYALKSIDVDED